MGVVKLPSGKTAKVPDDLSREEVMELLFEKLPDGPDKEYFGSQLDTSGWGEAIGSTVGSIGGAAAGFLAGGLGAIPGGVAGGAAGGALGEGIEQWITGKGDSGDIARAGFEGGAWGLIPGAGGQAAKAVGKLGAKGLGKAAAAGATQATGGAAIGGTGAGIAGQDPVTGAAVGGAAGLLGGGKLLGKAGEKLGKTQFGKGVAEQLGKTAESVGKTVGVVGGRSGSVSKNVVDDIQKIVSGEVKSALGRPTGKFQSAEGKLDLRRTLTKAAWDAFTGRYKRTPNEAEERVLKSAVEEALEDKALYQAAKREADELFEGLEPAVVKFADPSEAKGLLSGIAKRIKGSKPGSKERAAAQSEFDEIVEDAYDQFGPDPDNYWAQGGKVLDKKISKIYKEGYTAPGQAYAIAKSMGYNQGGLLGK